MRFLRNIGDLLKEFAELLLTRFPNYYLELASTRVFYSWFGFSRKTVLLRAMVLTVFASFTTYHLQRLGLFGARYQFSFEDVLSADRIASATGLSGLMFLLVYGILLREFDSKFSALLQMRNEILLETFSIDSESLLEQVDSMARARYFLFADLCAGYHMTQNKAFTKVFVESVAVVFHTSMKDDKQTQHFLNRTSFLSDFLANEAANREVWMQRLLSAKAESVSANHRGRSPNSRLDRAS